MKTRITCACLLGLALAWWCLHGLARPDARDRLASSSHAEPARPAPTARSAAPSPGVRAEAPPLEAPATPAAEAGARTPPIRRVLAQRWIDPPHKASRRRVRTVEADFKYPLLRLEEIAHRTPDDGERIVLRKASVADHLLVGLPRGTKRSELLAAVRPLGFDLRAFEEDAFALLEFDDASAPSAFERRLAELEGLDRFIDFAEPDYLVFPCRVPNDSRFERGEQWALDNPGDRPDSLEDADIDAPEAWDVRSSAPDVIVAVTDTGIQFNHEDLRGNLWTAPDGTYGFDAYDNDFIPMDVDGHGTHVAGIIGARGDNGRGISGVAWEVRLMGLRFLGPAGGTSSDAIRVINFARQNGADVINASWGGGGYSQGLHDAILACEEAGIPFVAAAGNNASSNDATPIYPASYRLNGILSVGASTRRDEISSFSNYGGIVDIAAPGSEIVSCGALSDQQYVHLSGTSMAAPHVAGALALARAEFPEDHGDELIRRIRYMADRNIPVSSWLRTGRLNLERVLTSTRPGIPHDTYSRPERITQAFREWKESSRSATREPFEDLLPIQGTGSRSLWYSWQAPGDGLAEFRVTSVGAPVRLVVYRRGAGPAGLVPVTSDLDASPGEDAVVRFYPEQGADYFLLVDGDEIARFTATLQLTPPNDLIAAAFPIDSGRFSVSGSNRFATAEPFEQANRHGATGSGRSVWWRWRPDVSGDYFLTTQGSEFDTVLAVYSGEPGALDELASNDDRSLFDSSSEITVSVDAGSTYWIAIDGYLHFGVGRYELRGVRGNDLEIFREPENLEIALGERAVLEVGALSGSPITYQWFLDDEPIPGQIDSRLVIDSLRERDLGFYHVVARNGFEETRSATVQIAERSAAPAFGWSSGDRSVVAGASTALGAQVFGSGPLTYVWYRDGAVMPGVDGPRIEWPSVAPGDAGNYRLAVGNIHGVSELEFRLNVLETPWQGWEWRREGIRNAPITDIEHFDGEFFAVSGSVLLRSSDGSSWARHPLPAGFRGVSFTKLASQWLCLGRDSEGGVAIASSDDGSGWLVSPVTQLPEADWDLLEFKGRLIASKLDPHHLGDPIFHSTDGLAWEPCQTREGDGTVDELDGLGHIATDGNRLLVAAYEPFADGLHYHVSSDGAGWDRLVDPSLPRASPDGAVFFRGAFYLTDRSPYRSEDLVNWIETTSPQDELHHNHRVFELGPISLALPVSGARIGWHEGDSEILYREILPNAPHDFTAAASDGTRLVYGTDSGHLGASTTPDGISLPEDRPGDLESVHFVGGEFVAFGDPNRNNPWQAVVSGDGATWHEQPRVIDVHSEYLGFGLGTYWFSSNGNGTTLYGGPSPVSVNGPLDSMAGLEAKSFSAIEESDSGDVMASVTPLGEHSARMFLRRNGASEWTRMTPSTSRAHRAGDAWFASANSGSTYQVLLPGGTVWRSTGLPRGAIRFAKRVGGGFVALQADTSNKRFRAASSPDGINWTVASTTGLPTGGIFFFLEPAKLRLVGETYVALIHDPRLGGTNVYLSDNGTDWALSNAPPGVIDIDVGHDSIVGILDGGGIVQAGGGGNTAPRVVIESPVSGASVTIGSAIDVTGTILDLEESVVGFTCTIDGEVVASGTGGEFHVPFHATRLEGHNVVVRAMDSGGLSHSASAWVPVTGAEPSNLLHPGEGGRFVPTRGLTTLNGSYFAHGNFSLFRSRDGASWERVALPAFPVLSPAGLRSISGITAGNGTLVVQFGNGTLISTKDGVNWSRFDPFPHWFSGFGNSLGFQNGLFVAATDESLVTSSDGFNWRIDGSYAGARFNWCLRREDGLLLSSQGFPARIYRSSDEGRSWSQIPALHDQNFYRSSAVLVGDGFVIINPQDSRSYHSSDGLQWDDYPLGEVDPTDEASGLVQAGAFLFLRTSIDGTPFYTLRSADGGITWQAIDAPLSPFRPIALGGVTVARSANGRLCWSEDGLSWQEVGSGPSNLARLVSNSDRFLALGSDGSAWISGDGREWEQTVDGVPVVEPFPVLLHSPPRGIRQLGDHLILGGGPIVACSTDGGTSWTPASLDGGSFGGYSATPEVGDGIAMTFTQRGNTWSLCRSEDGIDWTALPLPGAVIPAGISWAAGTWCLLGRGGEVFRSANHGDQWQQLESVPTRRGDALFWFEDRWIVLGSTASGAFGPKHVFTLETDGTMLDRGPAPTNFDFDSFAVGHGRILASEDDSLFISEDAIEWIEIDLGFDGALCATPDGFLMLESFVSNWAYPPIYRRSGPDGLVWEAAGFSHDGVTGLGGIGERVFLFGPGLLLEATRSDLALRITHLPEQTLGVDQELAVEVGLSNLGEGAPDSGWEVVAWLSKDRFFGDGNDVAIGRQALPDVSGLLGGGAVSLRFRLPGEVLTGPSFLVLSLENSNAIEVNSANNTTISLDPSIVIPEWRLELEVDGNGEVQRDLAANLYPHGTVVSLTANAGKGAAFTGWSGDAVGMLDQVSLTMDAPKSVAASFAERVPLQLFVRGAGAVQGHTPGLGYPVGATIPLEARPDPGWEFDGWTGASTSNNPDLKLPLDGAATLTAVFVQGIEDWRSRRFSPVQLADPSISGDDRDPDRDGISNVWEYRHGSNPLDSASTGIVAQGVAGGFFFLHFTRHQGVPQAEFLHPDGSRGLGGGAWRSPELEVRLLDTTNGVETLEARLPLAGGKNGFIRLITGSELEE